MEKEQVLADTTEICRKVFNDQGLDITEASNAGSIAEWDSMTNLFLIDSLEKHFDIKFSLDEIMNAQNVGDLCNIILSKKNN